MSNFPIDREIPYEDSCMCDICGEEGAYDLMGDYVCSTCLRHRKDRPPLFGETGI